MKTQQCLPFNCILSRSARALILIISALGIAPSVAAASASSVASATLMTPIAITAGMGLSFGKFSASGTAGTVTVSHSNGRTGTAVTMVDAGSEHNAAQFFVSGKANTTYAIAYTGVSAITAISDNVGAAMAFTRTSSLTNSDTVTGTIDTGTMSSDGTQRIFIGGTLSVAANQPPGHYSGIIGVTVEYN